MTTVIKEAFLENANDILYLFEKLNIKDVAINDEFFSNNMNVLLLATYSNQLAGFLYAYVLTDIRANKDMMFLYSIDVLEDFRRKGIATQLIEKLKAIARDRECCEVFVLTNKSNLAATAVYEKTGGKQLHSDDVMYLYELL